MRGVVLREIEGSPLLVEGIPVAGYANVPVSRQDPDSPSHRRLLIASNPSMVEPKLRFCRLISIVLL